jgi:HNH endonuclease
VDNSIDTLTGGDSAVKYPKRNAPLEECYIVDPVSGCHIWQRSLINGYGQITRGGKHYLVHRWVWIQKFGPIPPGKQVDHVAARGCISRACINTDHMELVTNAVNSRRGKRAKLTPSNVFVIRMLLRHGASTKSVADRYGVQSSAIRRIRSGVRWANGT